MRLVSASLGFFCGKMASGKSTLAKELAARDGAMLLEQDALLGALFPGEIVDVPSFAERSRRLREALTPIVLALLASGVPVVLDFPANTKKQRAWFRELIDRSGAPHQLHLIVASDELCKRQLAARSRALGLAPGTKWTTEADYDELAAHYDPPADDEGFTCVRHDRG